MVQLTLLRNIATNLQSPRYASGFASSGSAMFRTSSADPQKTFQSKDIWLSLTHSPKARPAEGVPPAFGHVFSDHMAVINWDSQMGWNRPEIRELAPIPIHPGAKVLHYALQLFEGMKAYRGDDKIIRLFRPELNMERMRRTAARCSLPDFDGEQLIDVISYLVRADEKWVPSACSGGSLYLRPMLIGTDPALGLSESRQASLMVLACPVGGYFGSGYQGVRLMADPSQTRACSGGVGAFKMGSNYAPTIQVNRDAEKRGCHQTLWLSEKEEYVTEAGTMNLFMFWKNDEGEVELITPSLVSGTVLPGVTRRSIIDLARQWGQFKVTEKDFTMKQLRKAIQEERVYEMFGSGTAAVLVPVDGITYIMNDGSEEQLVIPTQNSTAQVMNRLYQEVVDIQYGRKDMPGWTREIA